MISGSLAVRGYPRAIVVRCIRTDDVESDVPFLSFFTPFTPLSKYFLGDPDFPVVWDRTFEIVRRASTTCTETENRGCSYTHYYVSFIE